jgi:hypothetical protein
MDRPERPKPTTMKPITEPVLNATRSAGSSPMSAAAAVRTLPRTAMLMPAMNPWRPTTLRCEFTLLLDHQHVISAPLNRQHGRGE